VIVIDARVLCGPRAPPGLEPAPMRAVVILLALFAAVKIGYQEYLFRASARDVIVAAYRERAIDACQRDPKSLSLGVMPPAWEKPASIGLVIGKSNLEVYFWQVDHAMWNARYRNPYLFLVAGQKTANVFCEFDIVHGAASVYRM
jgi:hypothetical protein